jgi:hypothetical protein
LRKKIRGEPLTEEERRLLTQVTRTPRRGALSQEQMTALLEERKRRRCRASRRAGPRC